MPNTLTNTFSRVLLEEGLLKFTEHYGYEPVFWQITGPNNYQIYPESYDQGLQLFKQLSKLI